MKLFSRVTAIAFGLLTTGALADCYQAIPERTFDDDGPYTAFAVEQIGVATTVGDRLGLDTATLAASEGGFAFERLKPQYAVGDTLTPPENVDWPATWALYGETMALAGPAQPFVMDPDTRLVYPTGEGVADFVWVLADGSVVTNNYVVGGVAENARPLRVYQTDDTRIVQPVKLDNRYAKIFGSVAELAYGPMAGMEGMDPSMAPSNTVVYGVYIDADSNTIMAKGAVTGKGVIVFYDSIEHRRIIAVRVLDVRQAIPAKVRCNVGETITPYGAGHPTEGLRPVPLQASIEEPKTGGGPYLYQHKGADGFSPHDGDVFALRPCEGKDFKVQVWWNETDELGLEWPFEFVEYEIVWPETMVPFLRSGTNAEDRVHAPLVIPPAISGAPTAYQEADGELSKTALASVRDGLLYAWGLEDATDVRLLLKLTGDDSVWFVPVRLVACGDTRYFDRTAVDWDVGRALLPRGGALSGLTGDFGGYLRLEPDLSIPAHLRRPAANDTLPYAAELYGDVTRCDDIARGASGLPSEIVPVTTNGLLEAWWNGAYALPGMPAPLVIPCLAQLYRPQWPRPGLVPQIVLASAEGSACTSDWSEVGAMIYGASNTCLRLPRRPYLEDEGTLEFRYRSAGPEPDLFAPGDGEQVLSFRRSGADGAELRVLDRVGSSGARRLAVSLSRPVATTATIVVGGRPVTVTTWTNAVSTVETDLAGQPDLWHHVAIVETPRANGRTFTAYLDGADFGTLEFDGSFAGAGLPEAALGCTDASTASARARVGAEIGELRVWNRAVGAARLAELGHRRATAGEAGLFAYLTFEEDTDLAVDGSGVRTCVERTQNRRLTIGGEAYMREAGPPTRARGILASDTMPAVYRQPDPALPGCNPNEEHAFVRAGAGGYVVWALRCDLNNFGGRPTSEPLVLVSYSRHGRARMQAYEVVATNALYPAFAGRGVAGTAVPGPHPFDYLSIPNMSETKWMLPAGATTNDTPVYRDRTKRLWFRRDGQVDVLKYYPAEEAFDFPNFSERPALGAPVPWMAYWNGKTDQQPTPWHWDVDWPPQDSVPKMRIGQTLARAADGLAEVWNCSSLAVLYPDPSQADHRKTVNLFDPTLARTVALDRADLETYGFTLGQHGNLTQRGAKLFFTGLPPSLSDRFYYNTELGRLEFVGKLEEPAAGATVLYVNVLSADEAQGLKDICTVNQDAWNTKVVDEFRKATTVELNDAEWTKGDAGFSELMTTYTPRDHYALAAMGNAGWVTMVENDGPTKGPDKMVDEGSPVTLRVFRVEPEYYTGRTVARQDPYNLLSQQLTVMYTESFAGKPDDFEFEWRRAQPLSNGNPPEDYLSGYARYAATDRPSFTLGAKGSPLSELVNTYYVCRYRAKKDTKVYTNLPEAMKDQWSPWCEPPALAEGWVQRVLNNVTPFTQRMTDLYNNAAETAASMVVQAGRPWNGNVAMNQENLTSVGLVQLYQTLLNVAESVSTMAETADAAVSQQLLLAAERLNDLYTVLGDDAFSDAMDPTIGTGTQVLAGGRVYDIDIGYADTALFSFDNQLKTLLDEELALLRGRSGASAPDTHTYPVYNRLVWNMTRGITAGEVAYAVNYDARIRAANGAASDAVPGITADDAAAAYPQGHGDAYGHYLTAFDCWLRLLRNPNFDWPRGASAMNVGDFATAVDYYEESKVAATAAALARTAAEVVDRTARAAWRDNGGAAGTGYLDANAANAFGYGEWATRGGYGALCNWAVANALLPADPRLAEESSDVYREQDLSRIDRGTVAALDELCDEAAAIGRKVDTMDAGLNPLGLSADAIPFDITPVGLGDGSRTHYEQIRERAGTALANAKAVLAKAQESSAKLKQLAAAEQGLEQEATELEADYNAQLVAIFGKPYPGDVGPTGTYAQGYDGPDYYHYMWMDLEKFGLTAIDTLAYTNISVNKDQLWKLADRSSYEDGKELISATLNNAPEIVWNFSRTGLVVPDKDKTAVSRPVNGELQLAYAEMISAYANARAYLDLSANRQKEFLRMINTLTQRITLSNTNNATQLIKLNEILEATKNQISQRSLIKNAELGLEYTSSVLGMLMDVLDLAASFDDATHNFVFEFPLTKAAVAALNGPAVMLIPVVGAITGIIDWHSMFNVVNHGAAAVVGAVVTSLGIVTQSVLLGVEVSYADSGRDKEKEAAAARAALETLQTTYARDSEMYGYFESAKSALAALVAANTDAEKSALELQRATESFSTILNKGTSLMEKRALERKREVSAAAKLRYHDMFLRHERDAALKRYSGAFDLAQKYTFLAAKAYGYETGTSLAEAKGAAMLRDITATRSLGAVDGNGQPILPGVGDAGLAGVLAQLDANWLVEKGQLGINNPQPYATWFSVRKELFQILDGEAGDAAWKTALRVRRVSDLNTVGEYARLCQPVSGESGAIAQKEPGLVIEFPSTIDFAKNFFGNDLVNEGSSFDSSYFATKIASAGVFFENYNTKVNGYTRKETKLAETPSVYLIPAGQDRMRAPGQDDGDYQTWNVLDQVVPAPYAIGSQQLRDISWFPTDGGATGGADAMVRVRRYPAFRAYGGSVPTDAMLDAPRLAGRSVWNTRWLLIIPAGALNADREAGLGAFIDGVDMNHDGTLDVSGVSDIKIGFKTYSHGGR